MEWPRLDWKGIMGLVDSQGGPRSGKDGEEKVNFRNISVWAGSVAQWQSNCLSIPKALD